MGDATAHFRRAVDPRAGGQDLRPGAAPPPPGSPRPRRSYRVTGIRPPVFRCTRPPAVIQKKTSRRRPPTFRTGAGRGRGRRARTRGPPALEEPRSLEDARALVGALPSSPPPCAASRPACATNSPGSPAGGWRPGTPPPTCTSTSCAASPVPGRPYTGPAGSSGTCCGKCRPAKCRPGVRGAPAVRAAGRGAGVRRGARAADAVPAGRGRGVLPGVRGRGPEPERGPNRPSGGGRPAAPAGTMPP